MLIASGDRVPTVQHIQLLCQLSYTTFVGIKYNRCLDKAFRNVTRFIVPRINVIVTKCIIEVFREQIVLFYFINISKLYDV